MVIKDIHRETGMKSAAQWNAYHVACFLWNRYGTVSGKLIDTTRPVQRRDAQNRLIDPSGKPIVKRNGKPINNPYNSEAIQQLDRKPNPEALKRYPILSDTDLIFACFPNTKDTNHRRLLEKARGHWMALEEKGFVSIQKEKGGWRILPTQEHLNFHRALRKSGR